METLTASSDAVEAGVKSAALEAPPKVKITVGQIVLSVIVIGLGVIVGGIVAIFIALVTGWDGGC